MIDREWIDKRICHVKKHGDESDVHELAMLCIVKEHMAEHGEERKERLTHEEAVRWVNSMVSDDPASLNGGKWTMEQVRPIAVKYGVPEGDKLVEFWAVMNALYSDYYNVARKHNVLTPDFFADLTMAFINDKDAVKNKVKAYYEHIVEH